MSSEEKAMRARTASIDGQLASDHERYKRECKILLLGSGESGKSTIVKQMKIIHLNGYTTEELITYRTSIWLNLVDSVKNLVDAMGKLKLEFLETKNKVRPFLRTRRRGN